MLKALLRTTTKSDRSDGGDGGDGMLWPPNSCQTDWVSTPKLPSGYD